MTAVDLAGFAALVPLDHGLCVVTTSRPDATMQAIFAANEAQIKKLSRADNIVLADSLDVPKASARAVLTGNAEIAIPLEGLIDFEKERARLKNQLEKLIGPIAFERYFGRDAGNDTPRGISHR